LIINQFVKNVNHFLEMLFRSTNEKRIAGVLFVFFTFEKSTKNRMNLFDTLNGHIDSR